MKIVNNENETIIYPMLAESETETDDDFCIVLGNTFTMINNQIIDEDDIPNRRVVKSTPTAYYLVAQQTIVCHPSILEKLKAELAKKKQDAVEKTRAVLNDMMQNFTYSIFGVDQASKPDETVVTTMVNGVFQPRVLNNPYFNPTGT